MAVGTGTEKGDVGQTGGCFQTNGLPLLIVTLYFHILSLSAVLTQNDRHRTREPLRHLINQLAALPLERVVQLRCVDGAVVPAVRKRGMQDALSLIHGRLDAQKMMQQLVVLLDVLLLDGCHRHQPSLCIDLRVGGVEHISRQLMAQTVVCLVGIVDSQ